MKWRWGREAAESPPPAPWDLKFHRGHSLWVKVWSPQPRINPICASLAHLCYPRAWLINSLCVSGELRGLVGKGSITSEFWEAEGYYLCPAADLSSKRDLRGQDWGTRPCLQQWWSTSSPGDEPGEGR